MIICKLKKNLLNEDLMGYITNFISPIFAASLILVGLNSFFSFYNFSAFSNWLIIFVPSMLLCCVSVINNCIEYRRSVSNARFIWEIIYPVIFFSVPLLLGYLNFVGSGATTPMNCVLGLLFVFSIVLEIRFDD